MTELTPEPLGAHHLLDDFDCGNDHLNTWLIKRARRNEGKFARTFVVCDEDFRVNGFYSLSAGAIARELLDKRLQRNAPEVIPVTLLGRLAVDRSIQDQGVGSLLLHDALRRSLQASEIIGTRLVLLHAKDDQLREYYAHVGFRSLPVQPLTMVLPMETIAAAVREP